MASAGSVFESVSQYATRIARWWWILSVGLGSSLLGLLIDAAPGFTGRDMNVPVWVWVAIALLSLAISQFLAFHDLRVGSETKIQELEAELAAPDQLADLLQLEKEPRTWQVSERDASLAEGAYLSVRCTNHGEWQINRCRARIESLEQFVPDSGRWLQPNWFNPLLLAWSLNDGGGAETDIGPGSNRAFDLVAFEGETVECAMIVAAENSLRDRNRLQFGRWRLTCSVEADDCLPVRLQATIVWENRAPRNLEFLDELAVLTRMEPPPA